MLHSSTCSHITHIDIKKKNLRKEEDWKKNKSDANKKKNKKEEAWGPVDHSNVCNQQHSVTCEQEIN